MKVFTPGSVATHTGSKYLGVLVAAKYARTLNELRRGGTTMLFISHDLGVVRHISDRVGGIATLSGGRVTVS